jgi:hypothetical protein
MSEKLLYDISQQLRLLARRDCHLGRHGNLLAGGLDRKVEDARQELLLALELLQDRGEQALDVQHLDAIGYCTELAWRNRHQIAALRREAEFEQRLEAQAPKPLRFEAA